MSFKTSDFRMVFFLLLAKTLSAYAGKVSSFAVIKPDEAAVGERIDEERAGTAFECVRNLFNANEGTCVLIGENTTDAQVFTSDRQNIMYRNVGILVNGQLWCLPDFWPKQDRPVFYHSFDVTTGLTFHGATRVSGLVGTHAIKTNRTNSEWVDFGFTASEACITEPDTCTNGGSIVVWLKITDCEHKDGILSTRDKEVAGVRWRCAVYPTNSQIRFFVFREDRFWNAGYKFEEEWFHAAMIYNDPDAGVTVYKNGEVAGADTGIRENETKKAVRQLVVGREALTTTGAHASLEMDELSFWNRILSPQEVQELYRHHN